MTLIIIVARLIVYISNSHVVYDTDLHTALVTYALYNKFTMFELCLCLGCEAGVWSLNNAMWRPSENAGDKMHMAGLWEERINLYIFPGVKFWKDFTEVSVTSHVDYFFIVYFTRYFQYRKVKIEKQLNVMLAQRLALFLVNAESSFHSFASGCGLAMLPPSRSARFFSLCSSKSSQMKTTPSDKHGCPRGVALCEM